MLRVGVVGYGYWGPNVARNFAAHPDCRLVRVADAREERRALAKAHLPWIETSGDPAAVLRAADLDAAAIVTPVATHGPMAREALLAGKHVWVEKPMTASSGEAEELLEIAARQGKALFVDHVFLYTGAVRKMKALVETGELGDLYYYDSTRINLGLFQSDVNVVWDLAAHDLSIMDHLLGPSARGISAQGRAHFPGGKEDVAYMTVFYDRDLLAHFHVNWLSPVKVRQTIVGGSRKMVLWDDTSADEKIRIYSRGVEIRSTEDRDRFLAEYRLGDMVCPAIPAGEALRSAVATFVESARTGAPGPSDGAAGLRIVRMLEAADRSLRSQGATIAL